MAKNTVLDQLISWLNERPNDPYLIFVVATQYRKSNLKMARQYYEKLALKYENYTFTYEPLASLYIEIGEFDQAKITYEKGIFICQKIQDRKTLADLQEIYQEFLEKY